MVNMARSSNLFEPLFALSVAIEEIMEMTGVILFISALLRLISSKICLVRLDLSSCRSFANDPLPSDSGAPSVSIMKAS